MNELFPFWKRLRAGLDTGSLGRAVPRTPLHDRRISQRQRPSSRAIGVSIHTAATTFALAFLLAGCQTAAVKDRVVEVVKPVAIQPLKPDQVPQVPKPLGPRPQSLSAATDLLLSKWCESVSYFLRADPLLRLSAGEAQKALEAYPECGVR